MDESIKYGCTEESNNHKKGRGEKGGKNKKFKGGSGKLHVMFFIINQL